MLKDHAIPKIIYLEAFFHGLRTRQKGLYYVEIHMPYETPKTYRENMKIRPEEIIG